MPPRFDYRCSEGHTTESRQERNVGIIPCPECGENASRIILSIPRVNGIAYVPIGEKPLNVSRFVEAHDEIVHKTTRRGIEPPDFWKLSKERVRSGMIK